LAKSGKYPEAIASYQAALTQQPDYEDAQHNLDLLKKLLEEQNKQSSQDGDSQASDSSSKGQQQKEDGAASDQQSQEQKSGKGDQESNPDQAASSKNENDSENDSSGSTQDSSDNAKQSEEPESQGSAQDPQDNTDPSDMAQASPGENGEDPDLRDPRASASQSKEARDDQKSDQALQQWLRRIPDDPGGLLRRKFLLEHRRRLEAGTAVDSSGRPW